MSVKWKSGLNAPQYGKPGHVAPTKPANHANHAPQAHAPSAAGSPSGAASLPLKGSREALTSQLNALAYACTNPETQKILRLAADAAEADADSPWLMLRSAGPSNIPETVSGTIERGLDQGSPIVTFKPDDRSLGSFRLSPADLQGVADHGHVTIRKFGSGKGQKLEVDARGADRVRSFVGTVEARGKQLVAVALDPTAPIRELPLPGARPELLGKTILAHVAEPLSSKRFGIVEEVVPSKDGWRAIFLDLAARNGVEATFSPEEKADVAKIKKLFDPNKIQGYEDLTDKPFFAVDNPYSKDFDQAMHLEPSKAHPGATDVYYAIADVSYFLKLLGPGSALEARASRMQTTTYLPGLDAPVLDRALSEDLISLVAGQKRPAFVIKYTVGADGAVLGQPSFHDAVVKNRSNTNYPAVQQYLEGKAPPALAEIKPGLDLLQSVGGALLKDAKARGMMTSSDGESWATIDEKTGALKLEKRGSLWIEEANAQVSITANHLIGKYLIQNGAPAFHRVHPEPEAARLQATKQAVKALGVSWPDGKSSADVLASLDKTQPKWRAVRRLLLRALPRAVVSATPSAHAGLKLAEYVQSTAPMRRERDRRNHEFVRQVRDHQTPDQSQMEMIVGASNNAQDKASLLLRGVRDRLTAQALFPYIGKPQAAEVIGISPHGLDVYVPSADTEVFIPMRKLGEMKLDKGGLGMHASDGSLSLSLGDKIDVVVRSADPKKGLSDVVPRKTDVPQAGAVLGAGGVKAKPQVAAGPVVPLATVRGDGFTSSQVGKTVTTQGVVTALNGIGFYIQPLGAPGEDTGGGVLVRLSGSGVAPGDVVQVTGMVRECRNKQAIFDRTVVELSNRPNVKILESGHALPPAVTLGEGGLGEPPKDRKGATEFWRSMLGKRVIVGNGTAISASNRFGDLVILPDGWKVDPKQRTAEGGVLLIEGEENFTKVGLKARENVGGLPSVSVGDRVTGVEGVVTYRSGDFQLELVKAAEVTPTPKAEPKPTKLVGNDKQLTMASMNTLNLHLGEATRAKRLAERLVFDMSSPDIVALQEIQDNDGPIQSNIVDASETYAMLIEKILAAGGPQYAWADLPPVANADGGQPGANIRTGYLYRPDRVELVEGSLERIGAGSAAFEGTRKSLVARFKFNGHEIVTVNNHLTSRRGSTPWNAEVDELVVGGAERRLAQAEEISATIAALRQKSPKADVLVVGDYNDFPKSKPLSALTGKGMTNLSLLVPAEERYDYNYRGSLQALTSVVGNQGLVDDGRIEIEYLHHNSLNPIDDSDHDHVIVRVTVPGGDA